MACKGKGVQFFLKQLNKNLTGLCYCERLVCNDALENFHCCKFISCFIGGLNLSCTFWCLVPWKTTQCTEHQTDLPKEGTASRAQNLFNNSTCVRTQRGSTVAENILLIRHFQRSSFKNNYFFSMLWCLVCTILTYLYLKLYHLLFLDHVLSFPKNQGLDRIEIFVSFISYCIPSSWSSTWYCLKKLVLRKRTGAKAALNNLNWIWKVDKSVL